MTDTWAVALAPPASPGPATEPAPAASPSGPGTQPVPAASPSGAPTQPVPTASPEAPADPVPETSPSPEATLEVVAAAPAEPVPSASSTPEGPAPAPAIDLGCHGSRPCQRLIALGSIAGGLGLAALASGAALLIRPVTVAPDDPTTVVTYRPAGAALLAIGTGLAATWLLTLLAARKASRLAQRARTSHAAP